MSIRALRALRSARILSICSYPCAHIGFACIEIRTATDRIFSLRSAEVPTAAFDAYSIEVAEERCKRGDDDVYATPQDEAAFAPSCEKPDFTVKDIEIFRREEWLEAHTPTYPTVGTDPMMQTTGLIGTAPSGANSVTVICGLALYPADASQPPFLFYKNDYGDLMSVTRDESDIAEFRRDTTSEIIAG